MAIAVTDDVDVVAPSLIAALLVAGQTHLRRLGLPHPSIDQILTATGASRSRAYELAQELRASLPSLARPPGRPCVVREPAPLDDVRAIHGEILRFVMEHPGCVHLCGERGRYSDAFRLFVVELRERYASVVLDDFARAVAVPLGTIEDWLRAPKTATPDVVDDEGAAEHDAKQAHSETVLAAWRGWTGDFTPFCEHVRRDHRLDFGRTMIASILFAHGERVPEKRQGRSRDEEAIRGAFDTFFPGAQWVGDGKQLKVVVDGVTYKLNLELIVDAKTAAATGVSVGAQEDSAAVVEAFESGKETTGEAPLALLLDNKPSNHTPDVDAALGDTMRMRSTPGRAQNKAHVEGSFGLFAQRAPPIDLDTTKGPQELARTVAYLVALTFFRAQNHTPRHDMNGFTRVALYGETVTPEMREAAQKALRERMRKLELARQARAARLDPVVKALLDDGFARLALIDPERHIRDAIACYSHNSIVAGIAIFAGKRVANTLPAGVDGRYLLGIVKNVEHIHEADAIFDALLSERLAARDRFLKPLVEDRDAIQATTATAGTKVDAFVDRLVDAERTIDRTFWLDALAQLLAELDEEQRRGLARRAARRINAVFRVPVADRAYLVRSLLRRLWPLE